MGKVEFKSKEVNEFYSDYMDKISNRTRDFESLYSEIERYSNSRSDEEYLIASELLSNALAKRESEVTGSEIRYFAP